MKALRIVSLVGLVVASRLGAQTPAAVRPLTLAEALDIAEKQSETVGIARAELARAEGDRRRARSAYFPQLNGSASYQRTLRSQFS
ncbi:MAG TPA: TolC family protein, partial [Chloroflexota bacterium]|nr:TolC family protein [Chloroflexota bacterium]